MLRQTFTTHSTDHPTKMINKTKNRRKYYHTYYLNHKEKYEKSQNERLRIRKLPISERRKLVEEKLNSKGVAVELPLPSANEQG